MHLMCVQACRTIEQTAALAPANPQTYSVGSVKQCNDVLCQRRKAGGKTHAHVRQSANTTNKHLR